MSVAFIPSPTRFMEQDSEIISNNKLENTTFSLEILMKNRKLKENFTKKYFIVGMLKCYLEFLITLWLQPHLI